MLVRIEKQTKREGKQTNEQIKKELNEELCGIAVS